MLKIYSLFYVSALINSSSFQKKTACFVLTILTQFAIIGRNVILIFLKKEIL